MFPPPTSSRVFWSRFSQSIPPPDMEDHQQSNKEHTMESEIPTTESIDELRQRLNSMKKLMAERKAAQTDLDSRRRPNAAAAIIDGSFLSVVFGAALIVILTVSVYAFYNLYNAVLKKFPTKHTEL